MNTAKLGFLAIERGDHQEAVNIFRRALESGESAEKYFGLGVAHYRLGDRPTARWALSRSLERMPDHAESRRYIDEIDGHAKSPPPGKRVSNFRVSEDYLEVRDGTWKKIFIKGINLGLGIPGYFPGEFAIKKGTYRKWLEQIKDMGINAVRTYTVHPPSFYEALAEVNEAGRKLYLFQGIWAELPGGSDFYDREYLSGLRESVKNAVDAVYGNADLPERPGRAHGKYEHDVSPFTAGFLFSREWEACAVKSFNESRERRPESHEGEFLSLREGTPFEAWITRISDYLQAYEYGIYGASHPVTVVNWPTLDPLVHPSESGHDEEMLRQGITPRRDVCNENEDMETLDLAKIESKKGGGFLATYHVYPYYPDFLNNDYLEEADPYLAYLAALKRHHGKQPLLIGEFGVPSSRDSAHWQRKGWSHGGHDEERQGEINASLLRAIREAGMAGGILFSWCDEWFKKNWIFFPYYLPADRKPLWFNSQDPEQTYGLLAAYPGYPRKKVTLTGERKEWTGATRLYEKTSSPTGHEFRDGFDGARGLAGLSAQHDEGFLYLLVELHGQVDFSRAHYIIGLNTCAPEVGERLLPFRINIPSPIGLTFLIHLAGRDRSRILVCRRYDKYLNAHRQEMRPFPSKEGGWVVMQNKTNSRRISKDGKRFYPARVSSMSNLRFGSLTGAGPARDSLADFFAAGNLIELRIPWSLIHFTDPSSGTVLWKEGGKKTRKTEGISVLAFSYRPRGESLEAEDTGKEANAADFLPERLAPDAVRAYSWEGWNTPVYHTFLKSGYDKYRQALAGIPEEV
jgi:hypothetical protein